MSGWVRQSKDWAVDRPLRQPNLTRHHLKVMVLAFSAKAIIKNMNTNTKHQIKFTYGENQQISTYNGNTVFSNLFMFGAFANTWKYTQAPTTFHKKYETDIHGLKELISKTEETVSCLSNAVAALGTMMANANLGDIDTGTLSTYGWLIAGLGDLIDEVAFEGCEMSVSLKVMLAVNEQDQ